MVLGNHERAVELGLLQEVAVLVEVASIEEAGVECGFICAFGSVLGGCNEEDYNKQCTNMLGCEFKYAKCGVESKRALA